MVEVICDTNSLIHLATTRIKNIDNLDVDGVRMSMEDKHKEVPSGANLDQFGAEVNEDE